MAFDGGNMEKSTGVAVKIQFGLFEHDFIGHQLNFDLFLCICLGCFGSAKQRKKCCRIASFWC